MQTYKIKNTASAPEYLPIYQPEKGSAPNALNAYVPAATVVDLINDGNATLADILGSGTLKEKILDGTFILVRDSVELSSTDSIAAYSIIQGEANNEYATTSFLDNASATIALKHGAYALSENFVKAFLIRFSITVGSAETIGVVRVFKDSSGWNVVGPRLSADTTPNEDFSYSVSAAGDGSLSLVVTGSGTGQATVFKSITKTTYGI